MWILRMNMTDRTYRLEGVPEAYKNLGGRGLTSTMVHDEVPPLCHPLGPNNKLVFAPGIVTGTAASTSARISAGGKSPLQAASRNPMRVPLAQYLAIMQIKAMVVEGQPKEKGKYWMAYLTWDAGAGKPKVEFLPADEYTGKDLYEVFPKVYDRFGEKSRLRAAVWQESIVTETRELYIMILQNAPAVIPDAAAWVRCWPVKALSLSSPTEKELQLSPLLIRRLCQGTKKLAEALRTHAVTKPKGGLNTYGTAVLINIMNEAGGLPTRNFSSGRFEGAAKTAGESIFEGNKARTGKEVYNHACSPGCIIQCSNTWYKPDGKEHTSCVEYESTGPWAPIAASTALDDIAEMIQLCNAYGLDTIETGTTLAVAMEAV